MAVCERLKFATSGPGKRVLRTAEERRRIVEATPGRVSISTDHYLTREPTSQRTLSKRDNVLYRVKKQCPKITPNNRVAVVQQRAGADIVVDDFGERHTALLQAGILDHRVVDTVVEGASPLCTDPKWMS